MTAITTSLLGARLAQALSPKRVLLLGLAANIAAMLVLVVTTLFQGDPAAYPLLLVATAFLGAGFGLTVPVLNTYVAAFQPDRADRAVLTLNALLGLGTALAPVFVAVFVGLGFWWGLPDPVDCAAGGAAARCGSAAAARGTASRRRRRSRQRRHPAAVLAVRRLRRAVRDLRDHERQLVAERHDLVGSAPPRRRPRSR